MGNSKREKIKKVERQREKNLEKINKIGKWGKIKKVHQKEVLKKPREQKVKKKKAHTMYKQKGSFPKTYKAGATKKINGGVWNKKGGTFVKGSNTDWQKQLQCGTLYVINCGVKWKVVSKVQRQ